MKGLGLSIRRRYESMASRMHWLFAYNGGVRALYLSSLLVQSRFES